MIRTNVIAAAFAVFFVFIVGLFSVYTIDMRQQGLLLQFGAPVAIVKEPGLHTQIPFVQNVVILPKQLLNLEAPSEEVIAQDKKRLVVDAFARWRIVDPLRFYQAVNNLENALIRLRPILSSNVRDVLGSQSFSAMLSGKRAQLMLDIRDNVNRQAKSFGIVVVDVRIRRADLPPQNSQSIFDRMQQERKREANEFRAQGEEISQRIKARAEREVTVLTAEATRESEILRGEGDAQKTKILGDAYGQDPDFFAFYRSMRAYKDSLGGDNTTLVLSPNNEYLRYFGQGTRK
ncbi:MAG: protease modulator HflC [Proteobacteria bacterium]|nr:protease modulator HflC [Pseudomonadota bacterium]